MDELTQKVKEANRRYHDSLSTENYDSNESIFGPERQRRIEANLKEISSAGERMLDVGCGTGNVLKLAAKYFDRLAGVDISTNMLELGRQKVPAARFIQADAENLPFAEATQDVVSLYATLHHYPEPLSFVEEADRVLRPGGFLYTDHDPNYYLVRFYFPLYRLLHLNDPGFGSRTGELAEYCHAHKPGVDPEQLIDYLNNEGYSEVQLHYRNTDNPDLGGFKGVLMHVLKPLADFFEWPSLHTHFSIIARK